MIAIILLSSLESKPAWSLNPNKFTMNGNHSETASPIETGRLRFLALLVAEESSEDPDQLDELAALATAKARRVREERNALAPGRRIILLLDEADEFFRNDRAGSKASVPFAVTRALSELANDTNRAYANRIAPSHPKTNGHRVLRIDSRPKRRCRSDR